MKIITRGTDKGIRYLLLATLLVMAGCTNVGPDFVKPEAPVATKWQEADDPHINTQAIEYKDWWKVFNDPVLDRLIATAYQQNLSLHLPVCAYWKREHNWVLLPAINIRSLNRLVRVLRAVKAVPMRPLLAICPQMSLMVSIQQKITGI